MEEDMRTDEAARDESPLLLSQIAELLGVQERVFHDPSESTPEVDGAGEILRIWNGLEHSADRRKLLAFARALAAARE